MSSENIEKLRNQSNQVSLDEINHGIVTLSRTINDARYSTQPRILLELAIVTIASGISAEAQAAPRMTQTQGRPQVTARPKKGDGCKTSGGAHRTDRTGRSGESPQQSEAKDFDGNEYDLEEVWARIFAEGEGLKGSFNLIRTGNHSCGYQR